MMENKKVKKGTLLWWEHKWGNQVDIPYACMCKKMGFVVDVWMVFSTVVGPILDPSSQ
jgi:hypothetical protein